MTEKQRKFKEENRTGMRVLPVPTAPKLVLERPVPLTKEEIQSDILYWEDDHGDCWDASNYSLVSIHSFNLQRMIHEPRVLCFEEQLYLSAIEMRKDGVWVFADSPTTDQFRDCRGELWDMDTEEKITVTDLDPDGFYLDEYTFCYAEVGDSITRDNNYGWVFVPNY